MKHLLFYYAEYYDSHQRLYVTSNMLIYHGDIFNENSFTEIREAICKDIRDNPSNKIIIKQLNLIASK